MTDLDASKLKNAEFDEAFVLSSRVRTGRSIRGLRLPPSNDRAERREVERVLVNAVGTLDGDLKVCTSHDMPQIQHALTYEMIVIHFVIRLIRLAYNFCDMMVSLSSHCIDFLLPPVGEVLFSV